MRPTDVDSSGSMLCAYRTAAFCAQRALHLAVPRVLLLCLSAIRHCACKPQLGTGRQCGLLFFYLPQSEHPAGRQAVQRCHHRCHATATQLSSNRGSDSATRACGGSRQAPGLGGCRRGVRSRVGRRPGGHQAAQRVGRLLLDLCAASAAARRSRVQIPGQAPGRMRRCASSPRGPPLYGLSCLTAIATMHACLPSM